jgi:hypothetical protein
MKNEQQNLVKAIRHDRLRCISNSIILWKEWMELNRQEKLIKIAHERRALKMAQFLMQLENRYTSDQVKLVEETKSELEKERVAKESKVKSSTLNLKSAVIPINHPKIIKTKRVVKTSKRDLLFVEAMEKREKERMERKETLQKGREAKLIEMEVRCLINLVEERIGIEA